MKTVETSVKNQYKPNCRNGDIVIIKKAGNMEALNQ